MSEFEDLQQKEIELDLDGVPKDKQSEVKQVVGDFLVDAILTNVANGTSPVTGKGFQKLDKKYADKYKDGDRLANLDLNGDLLNSIGFRNTKKGIAVGITEADQRPKADGHNNLSGKSSLPERRFIPAAEQNFTNEIMRAVEDIVDEYRQESKPVDEETQIKISDRVSSEKELRVTLEDILSDDNIINALLKRIVDNG